MELDTLFYCNEAVLKIGRMHLRARRWREAETLAAGWLHRQPTSGDALALRGLVCLANGHTVAGEEFIQTAVTRDSHSSFSYLALAQLYWFQEKPEQALIALRRAIALDPAESEASELLAALLTDRGEVTGAESVLRSALAVSPCNAKLHFSLAAVLLQLGHLQQSAALVASGLDLDSEVAMGWLLRAQLAVAQALWPQARQSCERALLLEPGNPGFLLEKARISLLEGMQPGARPDAFKVAEEAARQVLALDPQSGAAPMILGAALRALGCFEEALSIQAQLVRSAPKDAKPVLEMCLTQRAAGNFEAALLAAIRAVSLAPDTPQAHLLHGEILLLRGELAAGFSAIGRFDALRSQGAPRLTAPLEAQSVVGQHILLHALAVQHALLYARYVPMLAQMGARISIAADPQVHLLLHSIAGVHEVLSLDIATQNYQYVVSMQTLPALFSTDAGTVPWVGNCCSSDADDVAHLREMFAAKPARRVGLNLGLSRDSKLATALAAAFRTLGLTMVTLTPLGPLEAVFDGVPIESAENPTPRQMAALLQALDLVVSVDSVLAHMAGVLGVCCHVLLPREHEGFWGCDGENTSWYPALRLYRETAVSGWEAALANLERSLTQEKTERLSGSPR